MKTPAELVFGKLLDNITYSDVVAFFGESRPETTQLEFKSCRTTTKRDDAIKGITEAVCAMLNAEGGIIVWGAPEGVQPKGKKEKEFSGAPTGVPYLIEKDQFVRTLTNSIHASPIGIRVHYLQTSNTLMPHFYIIQVDRSEYGPHQTNGRYFVRIDGQSVPAPHYLVESMFRRVQYAFLQSVIKYDLRDLHIRNQFTSFTFSLGIYNLSVAVPAENISYRLGLTHQAYFAGSPFTNHIKDNSEYPKTLLRKKYLDELYYGEDNQQQITIRIPTMSLQNGKGQLNLNIHLYGRNAPLRVSQYNFMIDLNNANAVEITKVIRDISISEMEDYSTNMPFI